MLSHPNEWPDQLLILTRPALQSNGFAPAVPAGRGPIRSSIDGIALCAGHAPAAGKRVGTAARRLPRLGISTSPDQSAMQFVRLSRSVRWEPGGGGRVFLSRHVSRRKMSGGCVSWVGRTRSPDSGGQRQAHAERTSWQRLVDHTASDTPDSRALRRGV